jgi:hypothetical protein
VSADGDRLYIADTNNHAIRLLHLGTGQLDTFNVRTATPNNTASKATSGVTVPDAKDKDDIVREHRVAIRAGCQQLGGRLRSQEWKLNPEAPSTWTLCVRLAGGPVVSTETGRLVGGADDRWVWRGSGLPPAGSSCTLRLRLYLCSRTQGTCVMRTVRHEIQLVEGDDEEIDLDSLF